MILDELCRELNNYFDENSDGTKNRYFGQFTVENKTIDLSETGIKTGQYFRIIGSTFNDGIYQYPDMSLTDETFQGAVWLMNIPSEFFALANDIEGWQDKYLGPDSPAMSPYSSESFGGYSYQKAASSRSGTSIGSVAWQDIFSSRLNKWRKIR